MRWMVGLIIATHMALQLHGACGSPGLKWLGRTGDVVAAYGHLSGSGTMFGFFAPRPGAPMRVRTLALTAGQWSEPQQIELRSQEGQHRFGSLIGEVRNELRSAQLKTLASSISAVLFDRDPEIAEVMITFEAKQIPHISTDRTPSQWTELASVRVCRNR